MNASLTHRVLLTVVPLLAAPAAAVAQEGGYGFTIENDHFSYWLPSHARPDREYTHGTVTRLPLGSRVPLPGRLVGDAAPCTGWEDAATPCTVAAARVGQKIFTPTPWRPEPGERPYAGWLFAGASVDLNTAQTRRRIALEVGVTGRASLAEQVQTAVHQRMGHGTPQGWDEQLAFEPAFSLRAAEDRVLLATPPRSALEGVVSGGVGIMFGTARTAAEVSLEVRGGVGPVHPWRTARSDRRPISFYGVGGVTQHAVARDLMLDGNTFRGSAKVERRPLVTEWTAGLGARVGRVGVEYRGVVRGREYESQRERHSYGSIAFVVGRS